MAFAHSTHAQEDKELYDIPEEETNVNEIDHTKEIGIDLNFSANTFGGSGGAGIKFGFLQSDRFIFGPSVRIQRSWYNFNGIRNGFSIFGGGAFGHVRFFNTLFIGAEIEFLSTPFQNGFITGQRSIVPTALLGGGFSRSFVPNFRLNAGIMYDIINHTNSPFRQGYFLKKTNGVLIPVMYRIAFFIPI